jgi:hypothetical protein
VKGWRREKSLADLSQRRNDAYPLQQTQRVPVAPGFFDLPIRDAVNIYPRNGALFAGSRDAHKRTKVGSLYCIARNDLLSFGDLILNREMEVGKSPAKYGDAFLDTRTPPQSWTRRIMQDLIGSDQFVYEAQVALVPNLIKPALGKSLVVFY